MNRILVVLPNWFGETLFATPFLRCLRQQRPEAFIATLGWPQCREVLLGNSSVDELIDYDEAATHRTLSGKRNLIRSLRSHRFDTVFILRKSLSRTLLAWLAGIPQRIGFANAKSGWLLTRRIAPPSLPLPRLLHKSWDMRQTDLASNQATWHKARSYLALLGQNSSLSMAIRGYDYVVSDQERTAARDLLKTQEVDGHPFIVLHPAANWAHKRWPAERFSALGDRLLTERSVMVVVTGGRDDVALADSVRTVMRQPVCMLAGRTSLRVLAACLEQAQLVVSNDTGVLHIAAALHRPLLALYGPTSPFLTGPLGDSHSISVLHHPDCCPSIPCYAPEQPPHPGMSSISVDEAARAAMQLLD